MTVGTHLVSAWSQSVVDALVTSGRLDEAAAEGALARAAAEGRPILSILADSGLVDIAAGLSCLSAISGVRAVDVVAQPPTDDALAAVPLEVGRRFRSIGYRIDDGRLLLACAEPLGVAELRSLAGALGRELAECVLIDPAAVDRLLAGGAVARPDYSPRSAEPSVERLDGPARIEGRELLAHAFDPVQVAIGGEDDLVWTPTSAPPVVATGPDERHDVGRTPVRLDLDSLLTHAVDNDASDLHLADGFPPAIRIDGSIRRIEAMPCLDNNQIRRMVFDILPQVQRERFEATKELDTSHTIPGVGRFRVSVFQQRGSIGAVLRMIPSSVPPLDTLGMPKVVASFADLRRGLVLVTGPTGSGKSTTLASIVDIINHSKPLHIMTVEDPIEFLHSHGQSIVNQREVGEDTESFGECLRHVLRQDPDVILVGELRDLETISTALTAAETGHLVFATLHTQDAPQTIDRMIDVFPPNQQDQVRIQLAGALEAVVTQQLILSASGVGRVPVAEVMVCTPGIRNLIRTGKTHQVYSLMQTGGADGMQTMDQSLARAVSEHKITESMAFDRSRDPKQLRDYLRG
jgi:twitching motility protein PilT